MTVLPAMSRLSLSAIGSSKARVEKVGEGLSPIPIGCGGSRGKRPEGDARLQVLFAEQHDRDAEDAADPRRQNDDDENRLIAEPGPDHGEKLDVAAAEPLPLRDP